MEENTLRDNSGRARILIVIFWILMVLSAVAIVASYSDLQLLLRLQRGDFITEDEQMWNDIRYGMLGLLQTALYIVSIVVFLNWFRRAYANLERIGVPVDSKNDMAIWSWFIPLYNVFKPVKIMAEIWNDTQSEIKKRNENFVIDHAQYLIWIWWALHILSGVVGRMLWRNLFKEETIALLIDNAHATMASDILQVLEGITLIFIVKKISRFETKLYREVEQQETLPVTNQFELS